MLLTGLGNSVDVTLIEAGIRAENIPISELT
jgi:hypothetical protein